jgi:hypothetical protein
MASLHYRDYIANDPQDASPAHDAALQGRNELAGLDRRALCLADRGRRGSHQTPGFRGNRVATFAVATGRLERSP